jgi:hypothetical protein
MGLSAEDESGLMLGSAESIARLVGPVSLQAGAPSLRQSAFDSVPRLARVTGIGRCSGFPGLLNEKQEAFKLEVCGLQVPPL